MSSEETQQTTERPFEIWQPDRSSSVRLTSDDEDEDVIDLTFTTDDEDVASATNVEKSGSSGGTDVATNAAAELCGGTDDSDSAADDSD